MSEVVREITFEIAPRGSKLFATFPIREGRDRRPMQTDTPTVYVVDDDPAVRDALKSLLRSVGLSVVDFESADAFSKAQRASGPCCLVLDVRMPGQSGLDLQDELGAAGDHIPIILVTGHGDIPMSVRAMKAGAVEFLPKPFREQELLDAIHIALERDRRRLDLRLAEADLVKKFDSLSPREREIMA